MTRLQGKNALITGSARGIGRPFAEAYIRERATVAIADISLEWAKTTASELGSSAHAVEMDVTKQASVDAESNCVVSQTCNVDGGNWMS